MLLCIQNKAVKNVRICTRLSWRSWRVAHDLCIQNQEADFKKQVHSNGTLGTLNGHAFHIFLFYTKADTLYQGVYISDKPYGQWFLQLSLLKRYVSLEAFR